MVRLRVSFFVAALSLIFTSAVSSAQTLDDPTKVDPTKQQGTPPATKPDDKKPDEKKLELKDDEKKMPLDGGPRLINEAGKSKSVGINSQVFDRDPSNTFQEGRFQGLEMFGFKYFASARETVLLRAKIKSEDASIKKDNPISALNSIATPYQLSFNDIALPAPDRYQLGPGDKLIVRYSSPFQEVQDKSIVVDAFGSLFVPVTGAKLTVRGMTLNQVQTAMQKEISKFWKSPEVTVTLTELRTMSVNIVGEVILPGNYQFPSVMTLFNALMAAGGPTFLGSIRNIEVKRPNNKSISVDLYKFLLNGDSSQDIPLQPGDTIIVPLGSKRAGVRGSVTRSMVYEIKDGERLADLVRMSGGPTEGALMDRIELFTVLENQERQLVNVDITKGQNPVIKNGDVAIFYDMSLESKNVFYIDGAVEQPRGYQWTKGATISTAIESAKGLKKDAYMQRADLVRENDDKTTTLIPVDLAKALKREPNADLKLEKNDRIRIYSVAEVEWLDSRFVELTGAVRNPGRFKRMNGMRLSDVILQAGGLTPEASVESIYIFRKNPDGTEGRLIKVDGGKALFLDQGNLELTDRDQIQVYRKDEVQFIAKKEFQILGSVVKTGSFPRSEGLTLKDALALAGGLRPGASTKIVISHSRVNAGTPTETYSTEDVAAGKVNIPILDGDVISIPGDNDFQEFPQLVEVKGRVRNPGVYAISRKGETIAEIIRRAGGLVSDAWTPGSSFSRNPRLLINDSTLRLSPKISEIVTQIQSQQYSRALAKSDIDKVRLLGSGVSSALTGAAAIANPIAAAGLGGTQSSDVKANEKLLSRETVSPARIVGIDNIGGNLPVRLDLALKNEKDPNNIIVRDGDIITIPETPSTVGVAGAVFIPANQIFVPGKTLNYYLEKCGSYTPDADRAQVLVIRPAGTVTKANGYTKIELGDTIYVPTKVMVASLTDGQAAFENIVKQITNTGLLYAIFRSLINR
jgi:protein involved in polysaccharide export with SLBB domain